MSDELAHLILQACSLLIVFLAMKLLVYLLGFPYEALYRLFHRQPVVSVGDTHQCRMTRAARENRNGVVFQLYRCAECDKRRWYEEGSSADAAPR